MIAVAVTDGVGEYSFGELPDGTYTIQVTDTSNQLGTYSHLPGPNAGNDQNSQPLGGYSVAVAGGATDSTGDFGFIETPAPTAFPTVATPSSPNPNVIFRYFILKEITTGQADLSQSVRGVLVAAAMGGCSLARGSTCTGATRWSHRTEEHWVPVPCGNSQRRVVAAAQL